MAKKCKSSALPNFTDDRPDVSPYTRPVCELRIGADGRGYAVPEFLIKRHPGLSGSPSSFGFSNRRIDLPAVNEDIGHTLVHYLYTGTYQTLKQKGSAAQTESTIEYKKAILVFCTARLYTIGDLEHLALNKLELLGQHLSIFQKLDVISDVYSDFPKEETWLSAYLDNQVVAAFALDNAIFSQERFLDHIGRVPVFSKILVRIMVDVLSNQRSPASEKSPETLENDDPKESPPDFPSSHHLTMPDTQLVADEGRVGEQDTGVHAPHNSLDRLAVPMQDQGEHSDKVIASKQTLRILEGRRVRRSGWILDDRSQRIGKLIEGDAKRLSKIRAVCDDAGNVWHSGNIDGRVELVSFKPVELTSAPVLPEVMSPFEEVAADEVWR